MCVWEGGGGGAGRSVISYINQVAATYVLEPLAAPFECVASVCPCNFTISSNILMRLPIVTVTEEVCLMPVIP